MLFWTARLLSSIGLQIEAVTLGWQVYAIARAGSDVRHASLMVGLIGLAQFIPVALLTLPAGQLADRADRRRTVIACLAIDAATAAALAAMSAAGVRTLAPVYAAAVAFGAARTFLTPSNTALGPMLVPRALLPRAIAWNSLAWQGASVVGPAIGGLICAVSPTAAFAAAFVAYLGSAGCLLAVRVDARPPAQVLRGLAQVREGLVYVWRNKVVLGAISLDLFAVLLGGATALLPVFARDVLRIGPEGFGILRAAPAAGAAVVAVALAHSPIRRRAGLAMFAGVGLFGAATVVFALSRTPALTLAALAVLGASDMLSVYVRQTLVQIATPDAMRGRVAAVSSLFVGASNELGEFESGLAARLLGPVGSALFGGVGALIVTAVWAKLFPDLRRADRLT